MRRGRARADVAPDARRLCTVPRVLLRDERRRHAPAGCLWLRRRQRDGARRAGKCSEERRRRRHRAQSPRPQPRLPGGGRVCHGACPVHSRCGRAAAREEARLFRGGAAPTPSARRSTRATTCACQKAGRHPQDASARAAWQLSAGERHASRTRPGCAALRLFVWCAVGGEPVRARAEPRVRVHTLSDGAALIRSISELHMP
mmetsp:Transcript_34144/g.85656  ORF Transcript_34144/g.85656 Transcript_34144/m.85656 type:complete len:202 (+) Transcript_34144:214-819(+)